MSGRGEQVAEVLEPAELGNAGLAVAGFGFTEKLFTGAAAPKCPMKSKKQKPAMLHKFPNWFVLL